MTDPRRRSRGVRVPTVSKGRPTRDPEIAVSLQPSVSGIALRIGPDQLNEFLGAR
jgi:hypothetical protein